MPKFVPRQRKHKVLQRQKTSTSHSKAQDDGDTNAVEIPSSAQAEKEKKRAELKRAISADQPHVSSKKKKRLDKYIVGPFLLYCFHTKAMANHLFLGQKIEEGRES